MDRSTRCAGSCCGRYFREKRSKALGSVKNSQVVNPMTWDDFERLLCWCVLSAGCKPLLNGQLCDRLAGALCLTSDAYHDRWPPQ